MKFLFPINGAPFISSFLIDFAVFLAAHGHQCVLFVANRAAEKLIAAVPRKHNISIFRRSDFSKYELSNNTSNEESNIRWLDFHTTWDRDVLWYGTYKTNYADYKNIISITSELIEKICGMTKPEVVIEEPPSNLLNCLFHRKMCERKTPYIGLIPSRIPGRTDIFDNGYTNSAYSVDFAKSLGNEDLLYFAKMAKQFALGQLSPSYSNLTHTKMHEASLAIYYFKRLSKLKERIDLLKQKKAMIQEGDYEGLATLRYTWKGLSRNISRKLNAISNKKIYRKNIRNEYIKPNYYIFPLHFQPEASTSGQSPFYCDLRSTIRYVSFSLPFPAKLLVKEHPHAIGVRSRNFYKEIAILPNVELIGPDEDNTYLIEKSRGIITLTSTLGLQAAIFGKPVYVLGDVFYTFHPNVKQVTSFEELTSILRQEDRCSLEDQELELMNAHFFYSYFNNSADISIIDNNSNSARNYQDLFERVKKLCSK